MNEILTNTALVAAVLVLILLMFGNRLLAALRRFASEEKRLQATRQKVLREALEQHLRAREQETGTKSTDSRP